MGSSSSKKGWYPAALNPNRSYFYIWEPPEIETLGELKANCFFDISIDGNNAGRIVIGELSIIFHVRVFQYFAILINNFFKRTSDIGGSQTE